MKSAFEGAEYSPSENAWVNIELELERAEGKKMRRRIFFYKMLAAASITFALAVAGAGIIYLQGEQDAVANKSPRVEDINSSQNLAETQQSSKENPTSTETVLLPEDNAQASIGSEKKSTRAKLGSNALAGRDADSVENHEDTQQVAHSVQQSESVSGSANRTTAGIVSTENMSRTEEVAKPVNGNPSEIPVNDGGGGSQLAAVQSEENKDGEPAPVETGSSVKTDRNEAIANADTPSEADPVQMMFQKLQDREKEIAEKANNKRKGSEESKREELWTSLGFAAGGYNGSGSHIAMSPANALAMNSTLDNQAKASGSSYSVNVSFGRRLSERLVIQGGLSYLNNSTNYVSNQVVLDQNNAFKPATFKDLRASEASLYSNTNIIPTAPHEVNSSLEFISLPIQAGYMIIDRKFGFQINAGVSTDFFIQNTIDPQGSDLQKTTQQRGAESPYRSTNFSGLMGTELTYRLGQNYRLSLNPGLRYPFNSIFKDETGIESLPLTFDVGLRFRYIFR